MNVAREMGWKWQDTRKEGQILNNNADTRRERQTDTLIRSKVKAKQSRYKPAVAQGVPGS